MKYRLEYILPYGDNLTSRIQNFFDPFMQSLSFINEHKLHEFRDLESVAKYFNLDVLYTDDLPNKVSGRLYEKNGESFIIINAKKSYYHQQFTIAHEIGHHVFLTLMERMLILEFEASVFAMVLLALIGKYDSLSISNENPEVQELFIYCQAVFISELYNAGIEGKSLLLKIIEACIKHPGKAGIDIAKELCEMWTLYSCLKPESASRQLQLS